MSNIYKAIFKNEEKFLKVINPDVIAEETTGILSFNTGIYGSKNDNAYPQFLIDLYNNASSAHQNLINLKSNLIEGNNLQADNENDEKALKAFLKHRNKSNDNLKAVYGKTTKDYAVAEGSVLQLIYNREGNVAEVYHVPFQNFRLGLPDKYGKIQFGYISQNWATIDNSKSKRNKKDYVKIKMFAPSEWEKYPVQLMYIKNYSFDNYALPSYNAGINWVQIDRAISDFHVNNIKSGFFISGMLTLKKGGMTDDEINDNAKEIEKFYSGVQSKKLLISYVEDLVNDKPVFETFSPDNLDKVFDILGQQAFQQIVTAHGAFSASLAGLDSKGSDLGGDANKLYVNLMAFYSMVVKPMQNTILAAFNQIMEINGLPMLRVVTDAPNIFVPIAANTDTTESERRHILYGLPPKDNSVNQVAPDSSIPNQ